MPTRKKSNDANASMARIDHLFSRPGFLLRRAHQLSVGLFEQHCIEFKLTPPQFGVLYVAATVSPLDQTTLSRALGYDKVTTLHIVRGLEARGLLHRVQSLDDSRKLELGLTPEGVAVLKQAEKLGAASARKVLAPLAPDEQSTLLALLQKLCDGLEDGARTPLKHPLRPGGMRPKA